MIVQGFKMAAVAAGIKAGGVLDLALIYSEKPATAAAVFTQNTLLPRRCRFEEAPSG
jgi:glutamate N-acetyltransferase/amino-acid N-acetyltransferase